MSLPDIDQKKIDDFVTESRKLTGQVINERSPWNTTATTDAIRHFAYGISDNNPLWLNADYAAKSRYGDLVAPPTFLISVLYPLLHGAPLAIPLTNLIGGLEFEWFQPILANDRLTATAKQTDVVESEDRWGRRVIYILAETTYRNQRQETVGLIKGTIAWVARDHEELLLDRPIYQYSQAELAAIDTAIHAEKRSGQHSPTGAEVQIGQKLPPMVRGPLTIGDLICWQAAIGPAYRAGTLGYQDCLAKPHTATTIPGVGWPVKNSQQHEDFSLTAQRGMPAPFDNGTMRAAWLSVLLTNWMGDEGFLKRLRVSTNAPIIYGDTTWYEGTVRRKRIIDDGALFTIKITGTNQLGEITTSGEAEVLLPRGVVKLPHVNGKVVEQSLDPARQQLSEAARQQLLVEWNDTYQDYPTRCIHHLFETQATQTPQVIAVADENQQLTYQQLNKQANRLAHYLQTLGIGPNDVVAICLERSVDMVAGILAILKAGGAYLPLDAAYPKERLALMLQDAQASVLLTQQHLLKRLPESTGEVVCLDTIQPLLAQHRPTNPPGEVTPDNLAYVLYTSGSTDKPKGVAVTHASFALYIQSIQKPLGVTAEDAYLHTASFSFSAAMRQLMLPLCSGARLVVASETQRHDPTALLKLMQQQQVTIWDTVPSVWRYCLKALANLPKATQCQLLDNQLCSIFTTGEALRWETVRAWRDTFDHDVQVINLYSQTETTGTVCIYPIPADFDQATGIVPLGRPVENTQVYLLDEQHQLVPIGQIGEVYVGDKRLAQGYLNQPELTARKFFDHPVNRVPGSRIYRTGDLARYRSNGELEPMGRVDDQVRIRGFRVRLKEIEATLRRQTNVAECVVISRDDGAIDDEPYIVAYLVPRQQPEPTTSELRHFLKETLPEYMIPSAFVILEAFPLNPNGKIDRRALPKPEAGRPGLDADFVAPQGPVETRLVEIWQEVLGVTPIGTHDNFFDLGGHSLLATQVMSRIRDAFEITLPVRILFDQPTVAKLALNIILGQAETIDQNELAVLLTELEDLPDDSQLP